MLYVVRDLKVYFPLQEMFAVYGVDFDLQKNSVFALVGETGSGKTMISKALTGLLPKGAQVFGKVFWQGEDLLKKSKKDLVKYRQEHIAMVFQSASAALNPLLNLKRQFQLCTNRKLSIQDMTSVLARVGLEDSKDFLKRYPFELSGGMKQRFLLAMALVKDPELLILDEPTRGLDYKMRDEIIQEIKKVHQKTKTCIFLITHDLFFAKALSEQMAVLYKGKIVERGETNRLLQNPIHPYVKSLIHSLPEHGFQIPSQDVGEDMREKLCEIEPGHFVRCKTC